MIDLAIWLEGCFKLFCLSLDVVQEWPHKMFGCQHARDKPCLAGCEFNGHPSGKQIGSVDIFFITTVAQLMIELISANIVSTQVGRLLVTITTRPLPTGEVPPSPDTNICPVWAMSSGVCACTV